MAWILWLIVLNYAGTVKNGDLQQAGQYATLSECEEQVRRWEVRMQQAAAAGHPHTRVRGVCLAAGVDPIAVIPRVP